MSGDIIKQQYIDLIKLLKTYHNGPGDKGLLQQTHSYCQGLMKTAKLLPDLFFAQPHLYKGQLPHSVNLTFNNCVLICLFGVRNKFDESLVIQLMSAAISINALQQKVIHKTEQNSDQKKSAKKNHLDVTFAQLLKVNHLQTWHRIYVASAKIYQSNYTILPALDTAAKLMFLAHKLTQLITANKGKIHTNFAQAIKHITIHSPASCYELIVPLIEYPSLCPPGTYIRQTNGQLSIIVALTTKGLLTRYLALKQATETEQGNSDFQFFTEEHVSKSYASQTITNFSQINQWWGEVTQHWFDKHTQTRIEAFYKYLPTQSAPLSLLVIQDQLSHGQTDISVITKVFENEPNYAYQLQKSASLNNRKKQPVHNIQHSLAMLGFERTSSLLLQHCLVSRLNQQYFALQQSFLTFSQLFVFIAGELAVRTQAASQEVARSTGYFVVSRLFTLPALRTLTHWNITKQRTFEVASLVKGSARLSLKKDAVLLANAWHQNKSLIAVLQHYDLPPKISVNKSVSPHFCYLIGLSLVIATEAYFTGIKRDVETIEYVKNALLALELQEFDLQELLIEAVNKTGVFCPLY
jgi:hypothetical protein